MHEGRPALEQSRTFVTSPKLLLVKSAVPLLAQPQILRQPLLLFVLKKEKSLAKNEKSHFEFDELHIVTIWQNIFMAVRPLGSSRGARTLAWRGKARHKMRH
jgi:hypothetical protein